MTTEYSVLRIYWIRMQDTSSLHRNVWQSEPVNMMASHSSILTQQQVWPGSHSQMYRFIGLEAERPLTNLVAVLALESAMPVTIEKNLT